jgi:Ca2+-binding EF-hand superfamily protein
LEGQLILSNNLKQITNMKIKCFPLLGLALALGTTSASAGDRSFGDGLPSFLQDFDVDGNGSIDEEERQAIKDHFAAWREERAAARAARRAEIDTDGDGEISDEERAAAREAAREALLAKIEARRVERFAEIAGEDDSISLDEFAAIPGMDRLSDERVGAIFARMDADESGGVDIDEFNSRLQGHRSSWGGGERPQMPNWREMLDRVRERIRSFHDSGDEDDEG